MTPKDIYDFHVWFTETYKNLLGQRFSTMYQALLLAVARNAKTIVETGTSRQPGNWTGDGQSTSVFGAFAKRYGCRVWTCDNDEAAIMIARTTTTEFSGQLEFVLRDSVVFLRDFPQQIDLLYLDSMDFSATANPDVPQVHAEREAQAALGKLHTQSIVLIDDFGLPYGGKGGKAVPFMLGQGWQVIGLGYQVLLTHAFSLPMQS